MKKKFVCLLLCLCVFASSIPAASAYTNVSNWAAESVSSMSELGFLPDSLMNADMGRTITRGEMCKMAVRVYENYMGGYAYPDSTDHFTDTADPDISFAFEQGIINGYGDGTFGPNNPLTRQDFFKITHNLMRTLYWIAPTENLDDLSRFSDAGTVSAYAIEPTQVMVTIGVVKGDGKKLLPKENTSCEEAVAMFFRAYLYLGEWYNTQTEETKIVAILEDGYTGISTWAIREVREMQENGMIPDCLNKSNMSNAITRAQMCSIAVLAYEKATGTTVTPSGTNHFTDTTDPDVNAAYELDIVDGMGDGRFAPNETLTREQFFKIMANFMAALEYPRTDSRSVSLSKYSDGGSVAGWAQAPTRLMIYIGAVRGDGKNLTPKSATSIQEAVAVFLRSYKYTLAWKAEHPNGEEYEEPTIIEDITAFAKSFAGYPYVYGGNGPNNFDCSGFVLYVYKHFGYSFSRGAQEQYLDGVDIDYDDLVPGDLVFFSSHSPNSDNFRSITHVGLYLGDGYFIHAANPTRGVVIDTLWSGYYETHFWGACRIITE